MELTHKINEASQKAKQLKKDLSAADFKRFITLDGMYEQSTIESLMDPTSWVDVIENGTDAIVPSVEQLIWVIQKSKVDKRDIPLFKMFLDFHEANLHIKISNKSGQQATKDDLKLQAELQRCQKTFYEAMTDCEFTVLNQQMVLVNNRVGAKIVHFNNLNNNKNCEKSSNNASAAATAFATGNVLDFILGDKRRPSATLDQERMASFREEQARESAKMEFSKLVDDIKGMLSNTCGKVMQMRPITCKNYLANSLFKRSSANTAMSADSFHAGSCTCSTTDGSACCSSSDDSFLLDDQEVTVSYFSAAYE